MAGGAASSGLAFLDYAVMAVYLVLVIGLGVLFSRNEKDTDDYLLGGRRMHWFIIGVSYMVSLMSTISLVSVPEEVYNHGLTMWYRSFIGPFLCVATFYLFVRFYFRAKTFTPFSYLESRFDRRVRLLGSLVFWWTRVTYLAMVLYSSSKVFEGAAGWPVWQTVLLVGAVGIVYTTMGGMKAVVWTDFTQFVVLVGGIVFIVVKCATSVEGGVAGIVSYTFENGHGFEGFGDREFYAISPYVRLSFWLLTLSSMMEMLFYNSSDQISIQRLLSTSSYANAKRAVYTNALIGLPFICVLWFLGMAIYTYYGQHPEEAAGITGGTALFRYIATQLPAPVPGLVISAMLAAVMSTLDSGMNSLAAVATKDVYTQYIRKDATERQQVRFSRIMTVIVGLFAMAVALLIASVAGSIRESIMEAYTIWGSISIVLAPVFLIGVTTRNVTAGQILISCIAAWIVTGGMVAWYLISKQNPDPARQLSFLFVTFPGIVTVFVLGYGFAFFGPTPPRERTDGLTLWTPGK